MSQKPGERDDDFVMTLSSGDVQSYALEPGITSIRSAFRQRLMMPLTLSDDWHVCLHTLIYTHSFGNALLNRGDGYHASARGGPALRVWKVTLSPYRKYHTVQDVVDGLVKGFEVYSLPPLSIYGKAHQESPSTYQLDYPDDPLIDYLSPSYTKAWLKTHDTLPVRFHDVVEYMNWVQGQITAYDASKFFWQFRKSGHQYAITFYARAAYDIGESLALMLGFLEYDPRDKTKTRIPAHNKVTFSVGANKVGEFRVSRIDPDHVGIRRGDAKYGGVRLETSIPLDRVVYMIDRKITFRMDQWTRQPLSDTVPYADQAYQQAFMLIPLQPSRDWLFQTSRVHSYLDLDLSLQDVLGFVRLEKAAHAMLPPLDRVLPAHVGGPEHDFTRGFVELNVVAPSPTVRGLEPLLGVIPLHSDRAGRTVEYQPQHLDFRPLGQPLRDLNELRVYIRKANGDGVPFYTGIVSLILKFHRGPDLPTEMRLQGGRRVTLESNGQLDVFPQNNPSNFKLRLPEFWKLDETWEVCLLQLLLPHTWTNVQDGQVGWRLQPTASSTPGGVFLPAGAYVQVEDVVEGMKRVIEEKAGSGSGWQIGLNDRGFYQWTLPSNTFFVLPVSLARLLGYVDFFTYDIPFYYRVSSSDPVVEVTQRDAEGKPSEVKIRKSHTMSVPRTKDVWAFVSPYSFQNVYVHCNISEPVYVGSEMPKVLLTHGVNTQKGLVENVSIPHPTFYRLSAYEFQDIEIDIRDNLDRPIPFQQGIVTATLYFRRRALP